MFYLISAERAGFNPIVNQAYMRELQGHLWLMDVQVKTVQGRYNGTDKTSFFVTSRHKDVLPQLLELATQFGQECILAVDDDQTAYFVSYDKEAKLERWLSVGTFMPVAKTEAEQCDGYSKIGDTYFTITQDPWYCCLV